MSQDERWYNPAGEFIETPTAIRQFLDEVMAVCRKHGLSIAHEDDHGAFMIRAFNESDAEWLNDASIYVDLNLGIEKEWRKQR